MFNNPKSAGKGFVSTPEFLAMKSKLLSKQKNEAKEAVAEAKLLKRQKKQEKRHIEKKQYDQLFESLMNGIQMPEEEEKKDDYGLFEYRTSAQFSSYPQLVAPDYQIPGFEENKAFLTEEEQQELIAKR